MKIINGYRVKNKKYKVLVQQNWLCEHEVIATNKKDITTRFLRDNKLNEIGAGTNEVMIMIIAKTLLGKEED